MSINKIIGLIIVGSFFVIGSIEAGYIAKFTRSQFLGRWYNLGLISKTYNHTDVIRCYWVTVTTEPGRYQNFKQDVRLVLNGISKKVDGFGRIINSVVYVLFPYFEEGASYTVTTLNNKRELILTDFMDSTPSHMLLSRQVTVSNGTRLFFEDIARRTNTSSIYFDHKGCTYKTVSVPIVP